MSTRQEILSTLYKVGLTKSQANMYLVLLQAGSLRIQQISDITMIPRTSVYDNIKALCNLGIVEKIIESNYVVIKAYPLRNLKQSLKERARDLNFLISEIVEAERAIGMLPNSKTHPTTIVRYYKGISGARQLLYNTLSATGMVRVYSAYGRSKFVGKKFYMDFVEQSKALNIQEMVLVNRTKHVIDLFNRDNGTKLARTNKENIKFLNPKDIPIKGETFIYNNIYAQVMLDSFEINGFEIESSAFVRTQQSIFNTLWKHATNFAEN